MWQAGERLGEAIGVVERPREDEGADSDLEDLAVSMTCDGPSPSFLRLRLGRCGSGLTVRAGAAGTPIDSLFDAIENLQMDADHPATPADQIVPPPLLPPTFSLARSLCVWSAHAPSQAYAVPSPGATRAGSNTSVILCNSSRLHCIALDTMQLELFGGGRDAVGSIRLYS